MPRDRKNMRIEVVKPFHVKGREVSPGETIDLPDAKALARFERAEARPVLDLRPHHPALPAEGCSLQEAYRLHIVEYPAFMDGGGKAASGYRGAIYFAMHWRPPIWRRLLPPQVSHEVLEDRYRRTLRHHVFNTAMHFFVRRLIDGELELRGVAEAVLTTGKVTPVPGFLLKKNVILQLGGDGELRLRREKARFEPLFSNVQVFEASASNEIDKEKAFEKAIAYIKKLKDQSPDEKLFPDQRELLSKVKEKTGVTFIDAKKAFDKVVPDKKDPWRARGGRPRKA